MTSLPLVIDCDPGIDDVVALALAVRSPELDIRAITTSYGNAHLEDTTRNAVQILDLMGRPDLHPAPGSDGPLKRQLVTAPETHGLTGVGHAPVPAAPPVEPNPTVLLDVLREAKDPVTLVTLGPLTNLAKALHADPQAVCEAVERHIGMFGNLHERGNTNRWADFNAWCDPEATEIVLRSDLPVELVGLDVTRRMTMSAATVMALSRSESRATVWLAQALQFYVEFHKTQERLDGCVVNDVLPIGELLHPGLLSFETVSLTVTLDEGEHRGHTKELAGGTPTAVALDVNIPAMQELLDRVFGPGWALAP